MRSYAALCGLWCGALLGCDPAAGFVDPSGKACTLADGGEPCPGGWRCDPGSFTCFSSDGGLPDSGTSSSTTSSGGTSGTTGTTGTSSGTGTNSTGSTSGSGGCTIAGHPYDAGDANPLNACQVCAGAAPAAWSNATNGTPCTANGTFCVDGACAVACDIGGGVHVDGGVDPLNPCQACLPDVSLLGWSARPDGVACGQGAWCAAGKCTDGCVLDAGLASGACGCASGVEVCNGLQVDTCVDDGNCGGCGTVCGTAAGCFGGQCGAPTKLPTKVLDAAALLGVDRKLYVIGGLTTATSVTGAVQTYDPRADRWATAPSLLSPRAAFATARDSTGALYALGGLTSFSGNVGVATGSGEVLRVGATSWVAVSPAASAFSSTHAALGPDGLFYLPGGLMPGPASTTLTYDPGGDTWGAGPSLRVSTAACGTVAGADGTLYSLGGTNTLSTPVSASVSAEALARPDGGWALVAGMTTPRCDFGTAVDSTGLIYTFGGNDCAYSGGSFMQYGNIEVFSPDAGLWLHPTPALQLLNATQGPACATADDGRLFCFGGYNGLANISSVQVFNPHTQNVVSSN